MNHVFSLRNNVILAILAVISVFILAFANIDYSYGATENTVTLTGLSYSYYADGTPAEYNEHGIFKGSLGNPVYCGNHSIPSPMRDNVGESKTFQMHEYDDELVRKILYYGYGGPEEWGGFNESKYNDVYKAYSQGGKAQWCGIAVTAMALTKTQDRGYFYDISGFGEFWNYLSEAPSVPKGFKAYIMYGNDDEQNLFTWIYNPQGMVKIEKIVEDKEGDYINDNLEGAEYGIFDNNRSSRENMVGKLIVDENGISNTLVLTPGSYYIKELVAPEGYLLDEEIHYIRINEDETTCLQLIEKPIIVEIHKSQIVNGEKTPLSGAHLQLVDKDDNIIAQWTSSLEPFALKGLAAGEYTLKEVTPPKGYVKAEDITIEVKRISGIQHFEIVNEPIKCSITIIKIDEKTGEAIENVGFKLYNSEDEEIASGYTDKEGVIVFDNLPIGEYYFKEVEAKEGYVLNENIISVTFDDANTEAEYILSNSKIEPPVVVPPSVPEIIKKEEITNIPLTKDSNNCYINLAVMLLCVMIIFLIKKCKKSAKKI